MLYLYGSILFSLIKENNMKGGSQASNSVISSVKEGTFEMLNKQFTNEIQSGGKKTKKVKKTKVKKGGSLASDSVTSLVSSGTYEMLNKAFTNTFHKGGKKGGNPLNMLGTTTEAFSSLVNTAAPYDNLLPGDLALLSQQSTINSSTKKTNTGNVKTNKSNVKTNTGNVKTNTGNSKIVKVDTTSTDISNKTGGNVTNFKTMSQLLSNSKNYLISNKKTGGSTTVIEPELKINDLEFEARHISDSPRLSGIANDNMSSLGPLNKSMVYGSPINTSSLNYKLPSFSFGQKNTTARLTGGKKYKKK